MLHFAHVYAIESGFRSGLYNMALDEALLETIRQASNSIETDNSEAQSTQNTDKAGILDAADLEARKSVLVVRTYGWEEPTLSLGVNQAVRDINFLLQFYGKDRDVKAVVRRPTGGRAILHGEDISYSFITNHPDILKMTLAESYAVFADLVAETLKVLDLPVHYSDEAGNKDYLRSPVCFETHTPSDLLGRDGQKLTGSAQLRRQGGILQHGAAFLKLYGVSNETFTRVLFETAAKTFSSPPIPSQATDADSSVVLSGPGSGAGPLAEFPMKLIQSKLEMLEEAYRKESAGILASAPITSGSHLVPASS